MTSSSSNSDTELSAPIDLGRVKQLFSDPHRLVGSDFLRREIAARMQERLALVRITPQRVLDSGCGEGADLLSLQKRFVEAQVLGIDASSAMIRAACRTQSEASSSLNKLMTRWLPTSLQTARGIDVLCGNFAQLPLAAQTVDLVWSNLALHWHPSPDQVFAEWCRVLRTDGLLMFSCFGPDTLKELRSAFCAVDHLPHVLPFVDMHDFGDMLIDVGFSMPVMDMETITVTYQDIAKLFADVRALGGNPLATRRRSLMGTASWRRLAGRLEVLRCADGTIPVTFEVIYGHAFSLAPKSRVAREAIVRLDFRKRQ